VHRMLPMLLLLSFGVAGCAAQGRPQSVEDLSSRFKKLAGETTPAAWHPGATWSFIALDKNGGIESAFVFEVTDRVASTCSGGEWKQLQVIAGDRKRLSQPAYSIQGRNLLILLSTALCDAEPGFRGELSDAGFTGRSEFSHLLGLDEYGKAYGVPVDATSDDRKPELTQDELALGVASLGLPYPGLIARMGSPVRESDTGEGRQLDYPGLTVWIEKAASAPDLPTRIYEVLSTSPTQCTPSGICPGMPLARATAMYGAPVVADREDGRFFEYVAKDASCWLQMATRDDVISSIRAECQP